MNIYSYKRRIEMICLIVEEKYVPNIFSVDVTISDSQNLTITGYMLWDN